MSDIFNQRLPQAQQRADTGYNDVYKGYTDIYNRANQPGQYGSYFKNAADTGLVTPENTARMRGGGVFDEFAKTGGLNDTDLTNLRARGTSTIPSYYDAVRNQFQNQNRIAGGTNPSYGGSLSRIARDQSRGASDAALNTELGITQQRNAGRQWGAGQMSFSKVICVLDEDIDVQDVGQVAWRLLANLDPKRDLAFVDGPIDQLDHGASQALWGSKVCIDGTRKWREEGYTRVWPEPCRMSADVLARVEAVWADLGIDAQRVPPARTNGIHGVSVVARVLGAARELLGRERA